MILYDEIASDTTIMIMICSNRFKWKLLLGFIDDVNVRFWLLHSGHSVASTARANSQGPDIARRTTCVVGPFPVSIWSLEDEWPWSAAGLSSPCKHSLSQGCFAVGPKLCVQSPEELSWRSPSRPGSVCCGLQRQWSSA